MKRREFIRDVSSAAMLLAGGGIIKLTPAAAFESRKNLALRFAIASDGHYGENGTAFDESFQTLVQHVTGFHSTNKLEFCVINGDIIHDQKNLLTQAKSHLDKLPVKYYVAKGNHDKVSDDYWAQVWGMPVNHEVVSKKNTFLLATTSNESGEYLSPDLEWLGSKLDKNKSQENVFLFLHIPQAKWTANAIETPAFFDLLKKYKNIRAVFHGHEHDKDDIRIHDNILFMFDSHFGGSWGTSYKGFRVVELARDNSLVTYIMNPLEKINQATF
jgi:DNA repair exonuclease SbcCD nuclease subunit